jgi:hypothetical protein
MLRHTSWRRGNPQAISGQEIRVYRQYQERKSRGNIRTGNTRIGNLQVISGQEIYGQYQDRKFTSSNRIGNPQSILGQEIYR